VAEVRRRLSNSTGGSLPVNPHELHCLPTHHADVDGDRLETVAALAPNQQGHGVVAAGGPARPEAEMLIPRAVASEPAQPVRYARPRERSRRFPRVASSSKRSPRSDGTALRGER